MPVDIIEALIILLKNDATLSTLVSNRIFGEELPRGESDFMPRKAVVLRSGGGGVFPVGSADFIKHSDQRIDALCYGETKFEAERVRGLVKDVLKDTHRSTVNSVLFHWINVVSGGTALRDPDTDWPFKLQSYQVFNSDIAVT